ncbi:MULTISPECIES: hypothetical protein [unclassified Enterococcus]|jgi:hypothetical protein|uniref:hypothetical protein n=1 Tax=unclassified Enterococcus TaxID=2608891 RepID=UPI0006B9FB45|nr:MULTISPECIES: hypothetical protein [unclassified Enterococcus]KPG69770.1 hypothetical protein AEQ18_10120 [Enterococcus sp. RIT-PI-f]
MVLTVFFILCCLIFSSITFAFSQDANKFVQPMSIKIIFIASAIIAVWTMLFSVVALVAWIV